SHCSRNSFPGCYQPCRSELREKDSKDTLLWAKNTCSRLHTHSSTEISEVAPTTTSPSAFTSALSLMPTSPAAPSTSTTSSSHWCRQFPDALRHDVAMLRYQVRLVLGTVVSGGMAIVVASDLK